MKLAVLKKKLMKFKAQLFRPIESAFWPSIEGDKRCNTEFRKIIENIKAFKLICGKFIVAKLLRANGGCLGVK